MPTGPHRDTDPLPLDDGGDEAARGDWRATLLTAGAYAAVGWLALMLAGPPGYASPLFPSAGIALAATLAWGRAALPGVWLGSLAVNAGLGALRGQTGLALLVLPTVIALGAALQAGVGAALVRRFTSRPLRLDAPRDIALAGLLGAVVASTISPSVATPALLSSGTLEAGDAWSNWATWWLGDTLGALIGAPAALAFVGRPAEDWRSRRLTVGLPMVAALALLASSMVEMRRLETARLANAFERELDALAVDVQARLQLPLFALQAVAGQARAQPALPAEALREAGRWWLAQPYHLQALGYSVRVPAARIAAFEDEARQAGLAGYRVFQRDDGRALARDGEVLAIRLIEPLQGNAGALGVNTWSVPAARAAVQAARASGEPAATEGFRLTQSTTDETGLVVYQALYDGPAADAAEREQRFRGVVFATVRAELLLDALRAAPGAARRLDWCLVDPTPGAARRRIAGPPDCDRAAPPTPPRGGVFQGVRPLRFAARGLELHARASASVLPGARGNAWLLGGAGLAAAAMLGALLLVVTGHSRRTELAVQRATAALRREMATRTLAQQALLDSEARLRGILDHLPIGVMFLDGGGRILDCNPRLCEMLGREPEALRGRRLDELVPSAGGAARVAHAPPAEGGRQRLQLLRADGRAVWVEVGTSALRDAAPPGRWVGVVEDITERLRLQASERALQHAEASNRAKSEFVSRMSHELRTPLNAMIGFAQLLGMDREPALSPLQRDWTQQIQRAGWHLLEMINETLDLARIEAGAVQLTPEAVPLAGMLSSTLALVAGPAAERGVTLSHELDTDAVAVMADATRLKQVLTNLLSNAVKYNRSGGSVRVRATRERLGEIAIAVVDSGLGMTPEQLESLFQPYNRLGRESTPIEGTGIGLVISRRLAELMGGSLTVRSAAGEGSTFTLRLPAAEAETVPEAPAPDTGPAPYRRRTVHYVEDNPTNVEVMRGVLLQRPQVTLTVSTNGLDGLEAIRRQQPDLVLLDMHLPDISGLELLRHLKHDAALAGIPVIVVSADATTARIEEALTLGAVQYVTKPLDIGRFLTALDEVLNATETRWGM